MLVKLFVDVACPAGCFKAGESVDLPNPIALGLIAARHAESLEGGSPPSGGEGGGSASGGIQTSDGGLPEGSGQAPMGGAGGGSGSSRRARGR